MRPRARPAKSLSYGIQGGDPCEFLVADLHCVSEAWESAMYRGADVSEMLLPLRPGTIPQ